MSMDAGASGVSLDTPPSCVKTTGLAHSLQRAPSGAHTANAASPSIMISPSALRRDEHRGVFGLRVDQRARRDAPVRTDDARVERVDAETGIAPLARDLERHDLKPPLRHPLARPEARRAPDLTISLAIEHARHEHVLADAAERRLEHPVVGRSP